jgi:GNAT superfamily N-acetyltransferase
MLLITSYDDSHHSAFRDLNMEWLVRYGLAEEPDLRVLSDPEGEIIAKGGFIWVAINDGQVVGTAALVREADDCFELAKMTVAPQFRGKGVGRMLIDTCIGKARSEGACKIELFSNHQLVSALKLYERAGFKYVPVTNSPFQTADIKMELTLCD